MMTERHDDFQLGLKPSGSAGGPQTTSQADVMPVQFSREEAAAKETQYTLLQLISMVRENPILYDEDLQTSFPEMQLKRQKREAWIRIRADMMWQDMTPVQDVWSELLEQYVRKSDEMSDGLLDAMRWIDPWLAKKKYSRPPSQLNNMTSSLDKDFFGDVPLSEDVLVAAQNSPSSAMNMRDYVVIQPARRIDLEDGRTVPSTSSAAYVRRKTPEPRETEAIVRTYPLSAKRQNPRSPHDLKKNEVKKDDGSGQQHHQHHPQQMTYGRPGVLMEVEPGYGNQKVYKVIGTQRSSSQAANVSPARRLVGVVHRGSAMTYEAMPPEPLIENPNSPVDQPPKKKMMLDPRMVGPSGSKPQQVMENKMMTDGVPIADDEIILETDGECKPMIGGAEMLHGPPGGRGNGELASTSGMHHYHHADMEMLLEDGGVVEDIVGQQGVVDGQNDQDMAIQYDEDLNFQQHINGVLNRLNDDEKAIMKFNMQKIILDARFGVGTARNMLKHEDMMEEVESHVEIDPNQESEDAHL